jgi:hypothetical protein
MQAINKLAPSLLWTTTFASETDLEAMSLKLERQGVLLFDQEMRPDYI